MSYKLHFIKKSKKEWDKLNSTIREQFKKKLAKRLEEPIVLNDKLSGFENVYKIKLRSSGFRLAYEVKEDKIIVVVLAVGKRENSDIYNSLSGRLDYEVKNRMPILIINLFKHLYHRYATFTPV